MISSYFKVNGCHTGCGIYLISCNCTSYVIQTFPGDLLESTYPDPNNSDIVLGRSEVERRREYINLLKKELHDGEHHPLAQMVKQCLQNAPSRRPTTEQLKSSLEEVRFAAEGPYGKFSKLDAVRQVTITKELVGRDAQMRMMTNELEVKTEETVQLRQQLEVGTYCSVPHGYTPTFYLDAYLVYWELTTCQTIHKLSGWNLTALRLCYTCLTSLSHSVSHQ